MFVCVASSTTFFWRRHLSQHSPQFGHLQISILSSSFGPEGASVLLQALQMLESRSERKCDKTAAGSDLTCCEKRSDHFNRHTEVAAGDHKMWFKFLIKRAICWIYSKFKIQTIPNIFVDRPSGAQIQFGHRHTSKGLAKLFNFQTARQPARSGKI